MLLRFLADYAGDTELRTRFARDPGEVLDEYQVSQEERVLFRPLDFKGIEKRMTEQVAEVLTRILSLRDEWEPLVLIYGDFPPMPISVEPRKGEVGKNIPFTIIGTRFNDDAVAFFHRPGMKVYAKKIRVNGKGTILQGIIKLPQAGEYRVGVDNGEFNHMELLGTLPGGFIATEPQDP